MALPHKRSEFEQRLCSQLNSLGEVGETLADRLLILEAPLVAMDAQQVEVPVLRMVADDTSEMLEACGGQGGVR